MKVLRLHGKGDLRMHEEPDAEPRVNDQFGGNRKPIRFRRIHIAC